MANQGDSDTDVRFLAGMYDSRAAAYDQQLSTNWFPPAALFAALRPHVVASPALRVLDVGVGTGQASRPWLELGAQVTGVDVSAEMLKVAGQGPQRFHALIEHDMNEPFAAAGIAAASMDVVVSSGVLHFAVDLEATLGYAVATLVPGGLLGFTYISPQRLEFMVQTRLHSREAVAEMVHRLGLDLMQHESLAAYLRQGNPEEPVIYDLVVARRSDRPAR